MWSILGFSARFNLSRKEGKANRSTCKSCFKHMLYREDLTEGHFYKKVKDVIEKETKSKIYIPTIKSNLEHTYESLVSYMVTLSSIDLLPHSHAIKRVMGCLTGKEQPVLGPGDALDVAEFVLWTPQQADLLKLVED